ncbi:hypothetical protein FZC35_02655 [Candidatus Cytomitobacter indipagum]|uniref:DNA-directed RNA polymerase subunit alpha n=1 Tax=Candidatus Cytomitobacter indipagum TaxID=2601575 RepID=A0A5C0UEQ5_9PROT|nr:DNA-directed RNA polymerase subunit alpha C-terminal domain-containing protein [Candidatus Cytomitobacter indipagum]QEK38249.1 hypothetical protein FZC35_02655 [Candidatus Cytomitobacter indipagum]
MELECVGDVVSDKNIMLNSSFTEEQDSSFVSSNNKNTESVVFGPLDPGYGVTVGNSIRRVLLSSIPGLGLVGFKIKGVNNVFSSIDGAHEDVKYIVINMKKMIFKSNLNEFTMSLKAKDGQVTAGMFSLVINREKISFDSLNSAKDEDLSDDLNFDESESSSDNLDSEESNENETNDDSSKEVESSDIADELDDSDLSVEILNPDQHICHLSKDTEIEIEIFVKLGKGYASSNSLDIPDGFIKVDASFSPIRRVACEISNVRVGQRTDYDQLTLNVETNGTVQSSVAVNKSCSILRDLFDELMNQNQSEKSVVDQDDTVDERWSHEISSALNLSNRAQNLIDALEFVYIGDLVISNEKRLLSVAGYGKKTISEIKDSLYANYKFYLETKIDNWETIRPKGVL